jgi:phage shock protein PspC (stress-responsive transcriptional regulator)
MTTDLLFTICNNVALACWLLLIFLPKWQWTKRLVQSGLVSLVLATVYLVLIVLYFGKSEGGFGSLADVVKLFQNPNAVLAGWVHYLAFDLFIGAWETLDAQKHGLSHWAVMPCLLLTFLFGPIGLLLYFIIKAILTKNILSGEIK